MNADPRRTSHRWVWLALTGVAAAAAYLLIESRELWAPFLAGGASALLAGIYVVRR